MKFWYDWLLWLLVFCNFSLNLPASWQTAERKSSSNNSQNNNFAIIKTAQGHMRLLLRAERTKRLRCGARREFWRFVSRTHTLAPSGVPSRTNTVGRRLERREAEWRSKILTFELSGKSLLTLRARLISAPSARSTSESRTLTSRPSGCLDWFDSVINIIFRSTSPLDEVAELPSRSRTTRRQASYLQAVQPDHLSAGERATFRFVRTLFLLRPAVTLRFILPIFTGLKEKFSDRLIFRMSQFLPNLNCLLAAITYV